LLVIDNADDTDVLFGTGAVGSGKNQLVDYIPTSRKGSVLFTTRTRAAAIRLAESNVIALGGMDQNEAAEVLRTRLLPEYHHQLEERHTVEEFLRMLSFLALAIVQAVAYINTNEITLADYITLYRKSERDTMELLSESFEDLGRYRNMKNTIATTWFVSFEEIRRQNELAADYLSFMACIANNDIPALLLQTEDTHEAQVEALNVLKAYTFVTERQLQPGLRSGGPQTKIYDVHPLVHLAMRNWLRAHDTWETWRARVTLKLLTLIPEGHTDTRHVWTAYLPHAIHVATSSSDHPSEESIRLLVRIGQCQRTLGQYDAAELSCRRAVEQREAISGKEHADSLVIGQLASALYDQCKFGEAETQLRELMRKEENAANEAQPRGGPRVTEKVCYSH
jgi:tetratricopeptide (TPR) repeat protein